MNYISPETEPKVFIRPLTRKPSKKLWLSTAAAVGVLAIAALSAPHIFGTGEPAAAALSPPSVAVSAPLQRELDKRRQFLGQFSAVEQVELRAQVGGTLTEIHFTDGDIVHKGDLLFVIDPTPYDIKLSQANARLVLARQQLIRAKELRQTDAGSVENVDQRQADALEAEAAVRDAQFDLDHTRVKAPFTGRIGTHMVSVGNLVSGSRAGTSATTLLATIVSVNPVYLNFDMSEADYMALVRERGKDQEQLPEKVTIALTDESKFDREGTLTFIDNTIDRSSGTIHARATVSNSDLVITPGAFARVRVGISKPTPTLLVPDTSVLPDQSDRVVLTVSADNVVTPKKVDVGDLRGGLRVIRSGLAPTDKVVIDGIPAVAPGAKVTPRDSTIKFSSDQE